MPTTDEALRSRVFTLLVGDKPVLAFVATAARDARQLCKEQWLRDDLSGMNSGGVPLWDGNAIISVRNADENERTAYFKAAEAVMLSDDELCLAYLVKIDLMG